MLTIWPPIAICSKNFSERNGVSMTGIKSALEKKRARGKRYEQTLRGRYVYLRTKARKRRLKFAISFKGYQELMATGGCYYCGDPTLGPRTTGIDRLDNAKGYELKNCVRCCWECNRVRGAVYSIDDMRAIGKMCRMAREGHPPVDGIQKEIDRILNTIKDSMALLGEPRIFVKERP
jgi:hypothetical protein